MSKIFAVKLEC